MLQAGIAQAALWQRQGHRFSVSLNVSAVDLKQADFIATLRELLARHALEPDRIEIEFTESAMIRHPQRVAEQLQEISAMGVKIAIDDFGSGHNNLSYLKRIPANALKIDQSFIRSLPSRRKDCMIVPSMIRLGHDFGQQVVAEGIETQEVYAMPCCAHGAATRARATGSHGRCRRRRWRSGWPRRGATTPERAAEPAVAANARQRRPRSGRDTAHSAIRIATTPTAPTLKPSVVP